MAKEFALIDKKAPAKDDPFKRRFSDMFQTADGDTDYYLENARIWKGQDTERNRRVFKSGIKNINDANVFAPPFWWNQTDMQSFYKYLAESPIHKGMLEAIGRTTIYAAQYSENPFAIFMKEPVTVGDAVMSGVLTPVHSRPWRIRGSDGVYPDTMMGEAGTTGIPLFNAQIPKLLTNVSRLEFIREIPVKRVAHEYARFALTPEMVGQYQAGIMSVSHAGFMMDMYEASKSYFCAPLRVKYDPITSIDIAQPPPAGEPDERNMMVPGADQADVYNEETKQYDKLYNRTQAALLQESHSPMIEIIEGNGDGDPFGCDGFKLLEVLHRIIEHEFYHMSNKYNPLNYETRSDSCAVIMSSQIKYPMLRKTYADTYHPEYLDLEPAPNWVWIDEFPKHACNIYNKNYHLIAIVTDMENPAIYPQGDGLSVQQWYDPQEESISIFTHYKYIFEFKPFFNRKYIYLHNEV